MRAFVLPLCRRMAERFASIECSCNDGGIFDGKNARGSTNAMFECDVVSARQFRNGTYQAQWFTFDLLRIDQRWPRNRWCLEYRSSL